MKNYKGYCNEKKGIKMKENKSEYDYLQESYTKIHREYKSLAQSAVLNKSNLFYFVGGACKLFHISVSIALNVFICREFLF